MTPDPDRRVRTVFFGSGGFAIGALARVSRHPDLDLVGVITAPARPVGRRKALAPTPVATAANEMGRGPVLTPGRLMDPAAIASVLELRPELAILADYGRIVPAALLGLRHGALNLHPSLLPRHRGATPIPAAILAGDTETGVTLFRMDEGVDTGPILAQLRITLPAGIAAPELEARLAAVGPDLLERALGAWLAGDMPAVPQPDEGATLTRPLGRDDGRLDPRRPAAELERAVRAYRPWPGTFVVQSGKRLAVLEASVEPSQDGDEAGRLVADDQGLALATGRGRLVLDRVRPAGGREMTGPAYRRGRPGIVGSAIDA